MLIEQLNAVDYGGAAIAARRLHHALLDAGVRSRFWASSLKESCAGEDGYAVIKWSRLPQGPWRRSLDSVTRMLRRAATSATKRRIRRQRPPGLGLFSLPGTGASTPFDPLVFGSDIIHLHWISGWLDYPSFFASIPDDFPIVWTLHDMNPLTGGCHYTNGCEAFATECRSCPQLGKSGAQDDSNRIFHIKLAALRGKNLHLVTPSHWLETEVRRSPIMSGARSIRTIHNGLDAVAFSPQAKAAAKVQLGIRPDRTVIGFGAPSLDDRRKGFPQLLEALALLPDKSNLLGLVFGHGGKLPHDDASLPELKSVGYVCQQERQRTVLSACDLFVLPSLEDNLPQTGVEAMACGTPVVAFNAGGIPDYVRSQQTGLLAKVGDAADLARQMARLIGDPHERDRMGSRARDLILHEFEAQAQARKYIQLYTSLLAERESSQAA